MAKDHRSDERATGEATWSSLLVELDRPLTPGFMTAGYTALGRYIFLATCHTERNEPERRLRLARC